MKVKDLIEALEDYEGECEVMIMMQQSYPFECSITGVVQREDFTEEGSDEDEDEESSYGEPSFHGSARSEAKDVFLLEGRQLRYGSKSAWDAAR